MQRVTLKRFSEKNPFLKKVCKNLAPYQDKLFKHELYSNIKNQEETKVFMSNHVFAVWDFMSLLKTLQRHFTCVDIPWIPRQNTALCHFINEIVLGEECDNLGTNDANHAVSHFELYIKAMKEVQANSEAIEFFVNSQTKGTHWRKALKDTKELFVSERSLIANFTLDFVKETVTLCEKAPANVIASCFLFGREDPIPKMFQSILNNLESKNVFCPNLKTYLQRHIDVDGGLHSVLAEKMIVTICGEEKEKWDEAEEYAIKAIVDRTKLWDGVMEKIYENKKKGLISKL